MSSGLEQWIERYLEFLPEQRPEAWCNFQAMRRPPSCPADQLGIDPRVRANQMGRSVDVN